MLYLSFKGRDERGRVANYELGSEVGRIDGGAGTVGLSLADGSLLIGTFAGDRIVRVASEPTKAVEATGRR